MKYIRLLADYDCYALWLCDAPKYVNISPETLAISEELAELINQWSDEYDRTLNREDPRSSGFRSLEAERRFVSSGQLLADRLKAELGSDWKVRYYNLILKRDIEIT